MSSTKNTVVHRPSNTPARPTHSRTRHQHYISRGLAGMALGLFVAAAALAVVKPADQPTFTEARSRLTLPEIEPQNAGSFSDPFIDETRIKPGDTVSAILQRLDVDEQGLLAFLTHDKSARSIYKLYPGRTVQAALDDEGRLVWLRYFHTPSASQEGTAVSQWLEVRKDEAAGFAASEQSAPAETHIQLAEGVIESSLFAATDKAGIPDAITLQMAEILSSKMDFVRDLRKGDHFRAIYETYSAQGNTVGAGRILALQFVNDKSSHEAVWFQPKDAAAGYYDFSGQSMKGAFLRSAIKFTRISSTFGNRRHPIHGTYRNHKGVDYAAPAGTPIHATADGTISFIGWQNGYGNVIILKHHGKYSTLYAHQRGFAAGLKKGHKVEQGQVIGYVGSTGWATGPHLHYEFRVGNTHVNPLSVDLPVAKTLDTADRLAFNKALDGYKQQIQLLAALQEQDIQLASR